MWVCEYVGLTHSHTHTLGLRAKPALGVAVSMVSLSTSEVPGRPGAGMPWLAAVVLAVLSALLPLYTQADPFPISVLTAPDIRPGLLVIIGATEGASIARLRLDGKYVVHALVSDAFRLDAVRAGIRGAGMYGPVSADAHPLNELPYADDMVNVVVVERADVLRERGLDVREIVRVLAPYGTALLSGVTRAALEESMPGEGAEALRVSEVEGWLRIDKPYPSEMDEWGQDAHDAQHSFTSDDVLAGPPRSVRWIAGANALTGRGGSPDAVASGGRIFFLNNDLGHKGSVEARDAFSGVLLWATEPLEGVRRVLADGETLYVLKAELEAWDAATGRRRFAFNTGGMTWPSFLLDRPSGILVAIDAHGKWVKAFEIQSGRELWRKEDVTTGTWTSTGGVIGAGKFFILSPGVGAADADAVVVCRIDLATGEQEAEFGGLLAADDKNPALTQFMDGKLILTSSPREGASKQRNVYVVSAADGRVLWKTDTRETLVGRRGGLLASHGLFWRLAVGEELQGRDPETGAVRRTLPGKLTHVLCGPVRATRRYIVAARNHFVDFETGAILNCAATRMACRKSCCVANGLVYYSRHTCACGYGMNGNIALSARTGIPAEVEPVDSPARLETGPALGVVAGNGSRSRGGDPRDHEWPTYRAGPLRGASVGGGLPIALGTNWIGRIGDSASAPVIASGRLFAAAPEEHRVVCLDANDGRELWSRTVGARVDSPPTVCEGLAIFGCRDGRVYALRVSDGATAWMFRAAPADRRIVVQEQIESRWPVFGSVLVEGGRVYAMAGHHVDIDGGLWAYALELGTGRVVWARNVRNPEHQVEHAISSGLRGEGGINDILRSDGKHVYVAGCFEKMAFDLVTGEKVAKVMGLPILSAPNDLLMPARHRTTGVGGAWGDPTNSSITWIYHAGPARTGMFWGNYHGPDRTSPRFDITEKWGYAADALAFDGARVFGAGREQDPKRTKLAVFGKPLADASPWFADPGDIPERLQGVILAGDVVVVAFGGESTDGAKASSRGRVVMYAAGDGRKLGEHALPFVPQWDGMAAAGGCLFVTGQDGRVVCLANDPAGLVP